MTRDEFNLLCFQDYKNKLILTFGKKNAATRLLSEVDYFEDADFLGDDRAGILLYKMDNIAFIVYLYVVKEFRGLGLAQKLVRESEAWAKSKGCDRLQANVFEEVKNQKFGVLKDSEAIALTIQRIFK